MSDIGDGLAIVPKDLLKKVLDDAAENNNHVLNNAEYTQEVYKLYLERNDEIKTLQKIIKTPIDRINKEYKDNDVWLGEKIITYDGDVY